MNSRGCWGFGNGVASGSVFLADVSAESLTFARGRVPEKLLPLFCVDWNVSVLPLRMGCPPAGQFVPILVYVKTRREA